MKKPISEARREVEPFTTAGSRETSQENASFFQVTSTVLFILTMCGIVAFLLASVIWFYESAEFSRDSTTTPGYKTIRKDSRPVSCNKRMVGYFTETESIDVTKSQLEKLTHAVFAYMQVNWDGSIVFKSEAAFNKFSSLLKKSKEVGNRVKVMFAIGGEHNSQYFATIASQPAKKEKLIYSVLKILTEYQIDGVDIYWKYAKIADKSNYISLLKDLRDKLNEFSAYQNYTVSITLPAARIEGWELAYDLEQTLEHVDFINVYSMDYHGPWEHRYGDTAGPTAPLFGGFRARRNFNVNTTMLYYVCNTKQPHRFNMAIPFYAMLWRNVSVPFDNSSEAVRRVELKDNKAEGKAYMSRIQVEQDRWKLNNATWDDKFKSSYIWVPETRTYLAFENPRSLAAKVDYVNSMNLGGVWIWSVDMDDEHSSLLNDLSWKKLCANSSGVGVQYTC